MAGAVWVHIKTMNYFDSQSAAERYIKGRPYFHPLIIRRIKEVLSITEPLSSALDVGCGTGLSTLALKEVSRSAIGVDASAEMIALAPEADGVEYFVARAEKLPFDEGTFDLITLSQVFHWLERDKFLAEAHRVLRPSAWLVAYDNYFLGQMVGNAEFYKWYREEYLKKYPAPPRAKITFTAENTSPFGFDILKEEWHENVIIFSLEGLVDYLVTQSNIIAAVEGGNESIGETRAWLMDSLRPMFSNTLHESFLLNAPIWYLQRTT